MENGNEKWLEQLKDSLKDYREPVPPSVKERLEKEWSEPVRKTVSFTLFRRVAAAAAALLLLFFSVKWLSGPQQEVIRVAEPGKNRPEWLTENKNPGPDGSCGLPAVSENEEPLSSAQPDSGGRQEKISGTGKTGPQADRMQEKSDPEDKAGKNIKNGTNVSSQDKGIKGIKEETVNNTDHSHRKYFPVTKHVVQGTKEEAAGGKAEEVKKKTSGRIKEIPDRDKMIKLSAGTRNPKENIGLADPGKDMKATVAQAAQVQVQTVQAQVQAAQVAQAEAAQTQEEAAGADAAAREEGRNAKRSGRIAGRYEKIRTADDSPADPKYGASRSGWQTGLAVANSGVSSKSASGSGGGLHSSSVMNSPNDFTPVPPGSKVVFLNGSPYLSNEKAALSYKHKQPVSFGLYIGRSVAPHISVETGLNYTLLMSDVTAGTGAEFRQTLHFMGIPVRANWSFLERKDFSLYLGAGGMLEKCVSGTFGREKVSMKELQYSVFAAPGIQYNLGGRFNIYFEPGIAYFFDNKSEIRTVRQDSPLNFTLQLGFRLAY